ncbi:MAG: sulfatase-like hydrolase/transferase [Martelella sp.]|uniref:sulfatase family protein n=1 Tax=Martelella sp. TaxID=1969699 RepID=UPI00324249B5
MKRPNILLIYTDQQRWDAFGANGNDEIHTPNLDRIAAEGNNFTHCFVQNPVCMPSRASMLTGRYPSNLGITEMGVQMPTDIPTLPQMLKPYGYRSANFGKLHFRTHANRDHRAPHPDYGFDQFELSEEPGPYHDAYRAWVAARRPDQLDAISAGMPPHAKTWRHTMGIADDIVHPIADDAKPANYRVTEGATRFAFLRGQPFPGAEDCTHSAFVADRTSDFLRNRARDGSPFLCIAGFYSPHAPWIVPQRFLDLYDPDTLSVPEFPDSLDRNRDGGPEELFSDAQLRRAKAGYYAAVSEVDHYVGQLLELLAETGLEEDTIVVFTSDHGEWLGEHLLYGKSYPAHDCISRVPLAIRIPGRKAAVQDGIAEAVDILPTLLELAGIQRPHTLNGRSLVPVMNGEASARADAMIEASRWRGLRSETHRYLLHADGREALFDLTQPLGEYTDLAETSENAAVLADLRHRLLCRMLERERPLTRQWPY